MMTTCGHMRSIFSRHPTPNASRRGAKDGASSRRGSVDSRARAAAEGGLCTSRAVSSGSGERYLDAAVLGAALRGVVRCNRIGLAEAPCTDKLRLHALRDHILHHGIGALFRQYL